MSRAELEPPRARAWLIYIFKSSSSSQYEPCDLSLSSARGMLYKARATTRKTGIWEGEKLCQILKKPCQMLFGTSLAWFWLRPKYEGAKYIWVELKPC